MFCCRSFRPYSQVAPGPEHYSWRLAAGLVEESVAVGLDWERELGFVDDFDGFIKEVRKKTMMKLKVFYYMFGETLLLPSHLSLRDKNGLITSQICH